MNKKIMALVGLSLCTAFILEGGTRNYSIKARKAGHFVNNIGAETRFGSEENQAFWDTQLKPRLGELGIKHVRGKLNRLTFSGGSSGHSGQLRADRINELYDEYGIKTIGLWKHTETWPERFATTLEVIDALSGIEIHNEANRAGERILYSDSSGREHGYKRVNGEIIEVGRGWEHALRLFTQDLSNRFNNHSNAKVRALPLAGNALTRGAYERMQAYEEANNWYSRDYVDQGNYHEYRRNRPESIRVESPRTTIYGGLPMVVTETGYNTTVGDFYFVNETIQSFYNMRSLLMLYQNRVGRSYVFSFFRPDDNHIGWGMLKYNNAGTGLVKKPQFIGIRDMITLLQGGNTHFGTKTVDYSITATPLTNFVGDIVLERSDGVVFIALWDARRSWNFTTETRIHNNRQVTFKLDTSGYSRAELYKPATNGTDSVKSLNNPRGKNFNFRVEGHPTFVKLIP